MHYLGIDYGEKRIGLSFADELGLAMPLNAIVNGSERDRIQALEAIIGRRKIDQLVIGYPYNMDGSVGFKAQEVDVFIEQLQKTIPLPIHRVDERLTSRHAANLMAEANPRRNRLAPKAKRLARKTGALDSRAATLILQDYLDSLNGFI